ncbi:MAG TPA: calcineurin-like phosphoesterase C-terminal domain-containing protein [Hyphomicrobiaceae bacterium]
MAYRPSRRQVLAGAGASALATSASALPRDPVLARGVVYEDTRGAGPRRPGDRGIGGVMVSNGRDVALTAPDGAWALAVEPGDSVFVIKPSQRMTRTSAAGLPQFSYLYQPAGSQHQPGSRFPLIEPTGPLPDSIDFALMRSEEAPGFEALLVSDTQPDSLAELTYVRDDIVAGLLGVGGAAFGINHGDVVADDLSLYTRYLRLLGSTGLTWHHCPGNHDINYAAPDDRRSRETWKRTFGPRSYAFQHGQATFFVLDNVEYLGHGRYRGALRTRQLQFIRNVLARVPREHLVALSMHIPLVCYLDPDNPADITADWRALLQALSGHRHTVSFAGHLHATEHHYLGGEAGPAGPAPHHHHILTAACGSWWSGPSDQRGIPCADSPDGTPNGFHVLSVAGNRYTTRFVPAAGKAPAQLRVLIDGPHRRAGGAAAGPGASDRLGLSIPHGALAACRVLANVFDGGPRTRVTLEVAGRPERVAMAPASAPDPLMCELFAGDAPRKSWVAATPCAHLWEAALPAGLTPGAHVLLIRARDEYGREHTAPTVLEVAGPGA